MSLTRRKPIRLEQLEPRLLLAGDFFTHQHDSHPDSCSCAECCGGGLITDASGTYYFDPAPEFVDPVVQSTDPITDGLDPAGGSGGPTVAATLPLLHSNPTATKKIYLDFDGQNVSGTPWNTNFNNSMTIHAPAFSLDDNISEFSLQEISHIEEIYHRVAEDFSPFDVDVTTESPPEDQFSAGGVAIRVLISTDRDEASLGGTGNQWFSDAGGVAYVNSWNWNSDTPVWVFENNLGSSAKTIAEAASHEIGHSLNLNHDGTSNNDYYRGHGDGDTGWAPIMGVAYDRELTQWSQGEYDDADNTEDDLWQISQRLGFRDDLDSDDPVDAQAATQLVSSGSVNVDIQRVIERTSDIDVFRIDAYGTTNVDLLFSPYETSPNLDIQVDVFDSAGTLLETSNPIDALNASFAATLDPGTYTVAVQGVGQGDVSTGYSDYGSLGQ
ncbi:MAG: M12 family metallo-peptidase, partial [Planctomycetota bacterium]